MRFRACLFLLAVATVYAIACPVQPASSSSAHKQPPTHGTGATHGTHSTGGTQPKSTPTKRPGLLVEVAIIPSSSSDDATLEKLAANINNNFPAYGAYVNGDKSTTCVVDQCDPSAATIFIRSTHTNSTLTLASIDVQDGAKIGSIDNVADVSSLGASDLAPLLGTPVLKDGKLALNQGYQQYLQLVPAPMSTSSPDYGPELIALLAQVGITAVNSSYTIAQLGAAPNATICANGERYLVYSVDVRQQNANLITGFTKVAATTNAYIADCVTHTTIPFWGQNGTSVPTTSNSLLTYSAFLAFLIPHWSWVQIGQGSLAFAKLVDVDPANTVLRNDIAVASMNQAVLSMCYDLGILQDLRANGVQPNSEFPTPQPPSTLVRLPGFTPFAFPTATPGSSTNTAQPNQPPAGGGVKGPQAPSQPANGPTTSGTKTSTALSNPLDLTSFTGPLAPPLQCRPIPTPTPLPTPTP